MIWSIFILMLGALAMIFWRSGRYFGAGSAEDSQAIYKAQIKALETDRDEGRLAGESYHILHAETARRLIASAEGEGVLLSHKSGIQTFYPVVVGLLILVSVALYALLGSPYLASSIIWEPVTEEGTTGGPGLQELLPEIEARLEANPDDLEGWVILARSYTSLGRMADAANAYGQAVAIEPEHATLWVSQAEALVELAEGLLTPAARLAFLRASALEPDHPAVLYYEGVAEFQDGNIREALTIWQNLQGISPEGAPWMASLSGQITRAEQILLSTGINAAREIFPGISAADAAAFQKMSNSERKLFLDGTVLRLRGLLEDNPEDIEGWLRVAAIEELLGRYRESIDSLIRAEALASGEQATEIREKRETLESLTENG